MSLHTTAGYSVGRRRREKILEAAVERFAAAGYHNTSMAKIAADVGLSEGGLLHHFPTKKHLLLAVSRQRLDTTALLLDQLGPDASGTDVLDGLVRAAEFHLTQPGLIELFVIISAEAANKDSPAHELFAERYEIAAGHLASLFQHAVDRGEFRADLDCLQVARECIAVSDGLQLQWVLSGGTIDIVDGIRSHMDRVRTAISV